MVQEAHPIPDFSARNLPERWYAQKKAKYILKSIKDALGLKHHAILLTLDNFKFVDKFTTNSLTLLTCPV
jgi:hypothetical protein